MLNSIAISGISVIIRIRVRQEHEITGYKFAPGDTKNLSNKIRTLLDGTTDITTMSKAASIHVAEHFYIAWLTKNLSDIYSTISKPIALATSSPFSE